MNAKRLKLLPLVLGVLMLAACGGGGNGDGAPTPVPKILFLAATDGVTSFELWKTDGSEIGPVRVTDICPGIFDGLFNT